MYKQVGAAAGHGSLVPVCISTKLLSACNMGVVCVVDLGAAAHASKAETQRAGRELVRAMLCMMPATTGRGTHHRHTRAQSLDRCCTALVFVVLTMCLAVDAAHHG
jgi:hypothetical protein